MQYLMAFSIRHEVANDVMSRKFLRPIVPDKGVKFRGTYLNRSREIPPKAVGSCSFDSFFRDNFRPEAVS